MNLKIYKIIASLLILMVLSACGDEACIRECDDQGDNCIRECGAGHCVDGDDWGYPKIYVSAEAKELSIRSGDSILSQYAEGIDSGQVLLDANYQNLVIQIGKRDQWTSWFGGEINPRGLDGTLNKDGFDGGRTVPDVECTYYLPTGKPSPGTFADDLSPTTLKVTRDFSGSVSDNGKTKSPEQLGIISDTYADAKAPCYFRYGMGLYVGFAPNKGSNSSSDDVVLTYHIPDSKKPDYAYDKSRTDAANLDIQARDGYLVKGLPSTEFPGSQTGDRLYFKIVDNTYIDNSGGYHVKIKEGTRNSKPGPLEKISGIIIEPMKLIVSRLYNGIVKDSNYINAVRAALVLYIVFYGFVFLMGGYGIHQAKGDVLFRVIKIALVLTLISDNSWEFFYKHLFSAFLGAGQEFAGLLISPFGDYDSGNPWYSIDQLLAKLWSAETWAKIASTILSNNTGILFVLAMLYALRLFIGALVNALGIYLVSFAVICVLVVLAPLVLVFMLFNQTKKQTEEWLNQMIVVVVQQIMLFIALGMFSAVILMFLERTIGYHVCWNIWNSFGLQDMHIFDFKFWMPDISREQSAIWIDSDNDGIKEFVTRYTDLPYFDPLFDRNKIATYQSESNFISLADILIFLCSVFLMHRFMDSVPQITSALKSTASFDSTNIFSQGQGNSNALTRTMNASRKDLFNPTSSSKYKDSSGKEQTNRGLLLNYARGMYGAANEFRKSDEGKNILGGISALAGAAAGAAKKPISAGIGSALDSRIPSIVNKRLEAMGLPHEAEGHKNIMSHQDGIVTHEALQSGANIADKQIMEKSESAKRGDLLKEKFIKDTASVSKLEESLTKFGSKYAANDEQKAKLAKPIFDVLKDPNLSRVALASIAKKSTINIDNIHANLSEQLQNPQKHGLTKGDAMMIQENLNKIKKAADVGRVSRAGIRVPSFKELKTEIKNEIWKNVDPFGGYKVERVSTGDLPEKESDTKKDNATVNRQVIKPPEKGSAYKAADAEEMKDAIQAGRSATSQQSSQAPQENAEHEIEHEKNAEETAAQKAVREAAKAEAAKAKRKAEEEEEEEEIRKRAEAEAVRKAAEDAKNKPS